MSEREPDRTFSAVVIGVILGALAVWRVVVEGAACAGVDQSWCR